MFNFLFEYPIKYLNRISQKPLPLIQCLPKLARNFYLPVFASLPIPQVAFVSEHIFPSVLDAALPMPKRIRKFYTLISTIKISCNIWVTNQNKSICIRCVTRKNLTFLRLSSDVVRSSSFLRSFAVSIANRSCKERCASSTAARNRSSPSNCSRSTEERRAAACSSRSWNTFKHRDTSMYRNLASPISSSRLLPHLLLGQIYCQHF